MVPVNTEPLTFPPKGVMGGVGGAAAASSSFTSLVLALIIPLLLVTLLNDLKGKAQDWFQAAWKKLGEVFDGERVVRNLEHVECFDKYGYQMRMDSQDEDRNQILVKALQLFMSAAMCAKKHSTAHTVLITDPAAGAKKKKSNGYDSDDDSGDEAYSAARELHKLIVKTVPAPQVWTTAQERTYEWPKVEIKFSRSTVKASKEKEGAKAGRSTVTTSVQFAARGSKADAAISAVVEDAFKAHLDRLRKAEDSSRYMFSPIPKSEASWKRYKLSEDKSFDTLFFAAKQKLLGALDDFEKREGKYSVEGFPWKLGLLLHGPPGTGKTSLIKALAQRTKRHLVNLPLSRVKTNQQLMDMMFDGRFQVADLDETVQLDLKDCIFVMEDVDACSDVVLAREQAAQAETAEALVSEDAGVTAPTLTRTGSCMSDPDPDPRTISPRTSGNITTTTDDTKKVFFADDAVIVSKDEEEKPEEAEEEKEEKKKPASSSATSFNSGDDTLNLAGLLNCLDGIVDSPNRIVVMTSNHPEKLDPALIRPGRINLKLHLGFIDPDSAMEMCAHYFTTASKETLECLGEAVERQVNLGRFFTPAQLEHLCAEYETLDAMVSALTDDESS